MDKDLVITVNIGSRSYRLRIDRNEEERTRKAVVEIEEAIRKYAKEYAFKDKQDLLAMVALDYALSALRSNEDNDYLSKELEDKLKEIDDLLPETSAIDH